MTKRRKFLQQLFLSSVGLMFLNACKESLPESTDKKKILIIGAGVSGLAAAFTLVNNGLEVIVLEADSIIGGRAKTIGFAGMKADLGASWIHGTINNPIYSYIKSQNIATIHTPFEPVYIYDSNGDEITNEDWQQWVNFIAKLEEDSYSFPDISLEELINKVLSDIAPSSKIKELVELAIRLELEIPYAEESRNLAANVLHHDGYYPGKHLILPDGMSSIPHELAIGIDVRTNSYVTKIEYDSDKILIHTIGSSDVPTKRACKACHKNSSASQLFGTSIIDADRVLITVPVSVLKNENIVFEPPLPSDKLNSINNIQMGIMNKVYMEFDNAFWPDDARFFSRMRDDRSKIIELMNMHIVNQKPVIIAFWGGDQARYIETLSKQDLQSYFIEELEWIFKMDVPVPIKIVSSKWHQSPYSLGSYPVIPPGFDNSLFQTLAKPVEDKLFFAGDATEKVYYGSIHGAYMSGIRAAAEILNSV